MDKEKVKPMLAGHRERVRDILYACTTVGDTRIFALYNIQT